MNKKAKQLVSTIKGDQSAKQVSSFVEPEFEDFSAMKFKAMVYVLETGEANILLDDNEFYLPKRETTQLLQLLSVAKKFLATLENPNISLTERLESIKHKLVFRVNKEHMDIKPYRVSGVFTRLYADITATQVFELVETFLKENKLNPSEVRTFQGDRRIYRKYIFDQHLKIPALKEDMVKGLVVSTSRLALAKVKIEPFWIRLICNNGMIAEEHYSIDLKHIGDPDWIQYDIKAQMTKCLEALNMITNRIKEMVKVKVTKKQLIEVLEVSNLSAKFKKALMEQYNTKAINYNNLWGVFNHFTYVVSHSTWKEHRKVTVLKEAWDLVKKLTPKIVSTK